jgi:hypothetical protein
MSEALDAFEVSKRNGQGGSMVAAATLRAKLNGLLVERKETGDAGEFAKLDAARKQDAMQAIEAELNRRARLGMDVSDVEPK